MTRTRRPSGSVSAGTGGDTVGALTDPTSLTSVLSCATWGEFIAPTLSIPRARRHTDRRSGLTRVLGSAQEHLIPIWVLGGISGGQRSRSERRVRATSNSTGPDRSEGPPKPLTLP